MGNESILLDALSKIANINVSTITFYQDATLKQLDNLVNIIKNIKNLAKTALLKYKEHTNENNS